MLTWIIVAVVFAVMLWVFWPQVSGLFRITANEGDHLVAGLKSVRREVKQDIKAVKRKLNR